MKTTKTQWLVVLAVWIPMAFFLGIGWCHSQMRYTPSRDAVLSVRDEIAAYRDSHGAMPTSLEFLPEDLRDEAKEYHIRYDAEKHTLSHRSAPYYDYSILYILTRGVLGKRSTCIDLAFDLTVLAE